MRPVRYVAGDTVSANFPLMNAYQSTNHNTSNGWVVFVSKLNPTGTALVDSTFIGGALDSPTRWVSPWMDRQRLRRRLYSAQDFSGDSGCVSDGLRWSA